MAEREFEGRVALVTGGSRGIGRAIAIQLAHAGARIAINYEANQAAANDTRDRIREAGGDCDLFPANVADQSAVQAMCLDIEKRLGGVDLLVANAGVGSAADSVSESTFEGWRHIIDVNLHGTYLPLMAVKGAMLDRGYGRIVCIASVAGLRERPQMFGYSVSKAAVIAMVRSAAPALGPSVRINAVAPGLIETDMAADTGAAWRESVQREQTIKRMGQPEDIAEAVCFLLSDRSSFMTGQTVVVDGGRVMLP